MKKLLIPNGSSSEIALIEAAKRLGYYVITSGNNPGLIGHRYADEYCPADFSDFEAMKALALEKEIDVICGNCNDLGMLTTIYVAEELGLPGKRDKLSVSRMFHEKDKFKLLAKELNIPTPKSEMFDNIESATEYIKNTEYPIIVKPVDLSAGRGVSEASNYEEACAAVKKAINVSKSRRIVIEEYLPGRQYDFHTNITDGKVTWYSASNEYSYKNPYQVSCLTIPADHSDGISRQLVEYIEKMAEYLNISDGPLWLQYRIKGEVPYVIESARRCGGNNMIELVSRAFSFDFAEYTVRLETGMAYEFPINKLRQTKFLGYQSLMAPCNGHIEEIIVDEDLKRHVFSEYYWYTHGEFVDNYLYDRYGIVLFEYENSDEFMGVVADIDNKAYVKMKKSV